MKIVISDSFFPLLDNESPYLVLIGGAGSGKSEFVARKLFYRTMKEGYHRFLVMRKVIRRLRESVQLIILGLLRENGVPFEFNKTERIVRFQSPTGAPNEILFDGLDDPDKIKSIVGITGIWLEEATEFTRDDFMQLDLRMRGDTKSYKQMILTLNPDEAAGAWIKEEFCFDDEPKTGPGKRKGSWLHHSTLADNPIESVRREYAIKLDNLNDKTYDAIYRRGVWALARGIIFNWDVIDKPEGQFYDEIIYGLDFGYSVDPAALIRIYRKADEFWFEEVIYKTGLTNPALAMEMTAAGITSNDQIYADSAEPKSIAELRDRGFCVYPADKGPDSVRAGIDFIKGKTCHIIKGSENIIDERRHYKYKERPDGTPLPEPVALKNHCLIAGTMIETKHGQIPIEQITTSDYILTRQGWQKVIASGMTGASVPVMTAYFSNGKSLTGTPDHHVWVEKRGFIPLDTMRYCDIINTCQHDVLFTREYRIGNIPIHPPSLTENIIGPAVTQWADPDIYIGKYGRTLTGKSLPAIMSIIGMGIRRIIQSTILNLGNRLGIARRQNLIVPRTLIAWPQSDPLVQNGIVPKRVGNGTESTANRHTKIGFPWIKRVTNAEDRSRQWAGENRIASVPINVRLRGDGQVGKTINSEFASDVEPLLNVVDTQRRAIAPVYVLRVTTEKINRPVYDLTIADIPEFYANGILVHNSMDGIRYPMWTAYGRAGGFDNFKVTWV